MLGKSSISYGTDDNVYYDVSITNNGGTGNTPAAFSESRAQPLLKDPSQYYLTISKFKIPVTSVPLFNFDQTTKVLSTLANGTTTIQLSAIAINAGETFANQGIRVGALVEGKGVPANTYIQSIDITSSIAVVNNVVVFSIPPVDLTYTSSPYIIGMTPSGSPVSATIQVCVLFPSLIVSQTFLPDMPTGGPTGDGLFNFIWFSQQFTQAVNVTFSIVRALIGSPGTHNPFIQFDRTTQLFSLVADPGVYLPETTPGVAIYFSRALEVFFDGLSGQYPLYNVTTPDYVPYLDFQVFVENDGNNTMTVTKDPSGAGPYTALFNIQEYSSAYNWNHFEKIVITTGTIPITPQYTNSSTNTVDPYAKPAIPGEQKYYPVLTDFDVPKDNQGFDRSPLQYLPQPQYRLIDMPSTSPLNNFDFKVFWQDRNNNLYQLMLVPKDYVNIKFLFVRKASTKSGTSLKGS